VDDARRHCPRDNTVEPPKPHGEKRQEDDNSLSEVPALSDHIAPEIRSLRKGRGIQAGDLDQRIGPQLKELAAGGGAGGPALRRFALSNELSARANQLADDLRTAIMASLGLAPETKDMPRFKDRVSWLARQLGYEYRTALRRIDQAERLLSEEIAHELLRRRGQIAVTPGGWYLDELRVLFRLDTPTPESYEDRRIVATRSGLREVVAWFDVPRSPGQPSPALSAEVLYGGHLTGAENSPQGRFRFAVELPRALQAGEKHEYGLLLRPVNQPMRPHYLFSPECQCDVFDLRVRFDANRRPAWIRRVQGETVRMFDVPQPTSDLVTLDAAGEVHVNFRSPTMYLGYGAQWEPY
jgi:hypothetical protein